MDVTQSTYLIPGGDEGKWPWLMSHLVPISVQGSTIIFVNKKQGVDALADNLKRHGFPLVAALHGDMHQQTRDAAVRDFKTGKVFNGLL